MPHHVREFDAGPDPFGKTWHVRFGWLQTAISIRHADAIDVKFFLSDGDQTIEKVISLPLPALMALSERDARPITDPWCMKLASQHIRQMVETFEDMEKTLITVPLDKLTHHAAQIDESVVPAGR